MGLDRFPQLGCNERSISLYPVLGLGGSGISKEGDGIDDGNGLRQVLLEHIQFCERTFRGSGFRSVIVSPSGVRQLT